MPKPEFYGWDWAILVLTLFLLGLGIGGLVVYQQHIEDEKRNTNVIFQRALSYHPDLSASDKDKYKSHEARFPKNTCTAEERDLYLKLHNTFRSKNNAQPLKWDQRLADTAQAWADKLYEDDCDIYHPKNRKDDCHYLRCGDDGQNLSQFVYEGRPRRNLEVGSIEEAVKLWTDECYLYDPDNPTKNGVGHFTQMIWKDTDKIGCAHRRLDRPGKKASIYVCHYNKSGNWLTPTGGYRYFKENVESSPTCKRR